MHLANGFKEYVMAVKPQKLQSQGAFLHVLQGCGGGGRCVLIRVGLRS